MRPRNGGSEAAENDIFLFDVVILQDIDLFIIYNRKKRNENTFGGRGMCLGRRESRKGGEVR